MSIIAMKTALMELKESGAYLAANYPHRATQCRAAADALDTAITEAENVEPVAWATRREDGGLQLFFLKTSAERESFCQMHKTPVLPLFLAAGAQPAPKQEPIPPGHRLVPVEPTEAMIVSGVAAGSFFMTAESFRDFTRAYKAMLAAAPMQAQPPPEDVDDGPEECGSCAGTGEGQYDGSSCRACKGRGYKQQKADHDE